MAKVKLDDVIEARSMCEEDFFRRKNVVAVAVGYRVVGGQETDELCVRAYVVKKKNPSELPDAEKLPPSVPTSKQVQVPVDVEEMAPPWAWALYQRVRPAMGGYSVAHFRVTAGTIATAVRDSQYRGLFHILSNNHVLANSNFANLGDAILQPAPFDGGVYPRDMIAQLCRFVPLQFGVGSSNRVDAAIACTELYNVDRRVYWIGEPKAVRKRSGINLGEEVQKTGRTTNYTQGKITGLYATVNVNYDSGRLARFQNQIITTAMSAGGDSGSLVLDLEGNALGLLFAGSSTDTIINHIEDVQNELSIKVAEKMV